MHSEILINSFEIKGRIAHLDIYKTIIILRNVLVTFWHYYYTKDVFFYSCMQTPRLRTVYRQRQWLLPAAVDRIMALGCKGFCQCVKCFTHGLREHVKYCGRCQKLLTTFFTTACVYDQKIGHTAGIMSWYFLDRNVLNAATAGKCCIFTLVMRQTPFWLLVLKYTILTSLI